MIRQADERITKIKFEHEKLMELVQACIKEHGDSFLVGIDKFMEVLKEDKTAIKKYEALVAAQNMVKDLINDIINAKSVEEVLEIRSKLNYYINKIKAEMKKREVDEATLSSYIESAKILRSDIARNIRYLKREVNIQLIDELYGNVDSLEKDDLDQLKKLIRKETRYNSSNLNPIPRKKKEVVAVSATGDNIDDQKVTADNQEQNQGDGSNLGPTGDDLASKFIESVLNDGERGASERKPTFTFNTPKGENPVKSFASISTSEFEELKEYLDGKAASFECQYGISRTHDYEPGKFCKNIFNFLRNIPHFIHNKRSIRRMQYDMNVFYRGGDIESYFVYQSHRNSVMQSLKCIFDRSYLFSETGSLINHHEDCSRWMYNYCRYNSLDFPIPTDMLISQKTDGGDDPFIKALYTN